MAEMTGACSVVLFCYGATVTATTGTPVLMTGFGLPGLSLGCGFLVAVLAHIAATKAGCHVIPFTTMASLVAGRISPAAAGMRLLAQGLGVAIAAGLLWLLQQVAPGLIIDPRVWEAVLSGETGRYTANMVWVGMVQLLLGFLFAMGLLSVKIAVKPAIAAGLAMTGQLVLIAMVSAAGSDAISPAFYNLPAARWHGDTAQQLALFIMATIAGAGPVILLSRRQSISLQ